MASTPFSTLAAPSLTLTLWTALATITMLLLPQMKSMHKAFHMHTSSDLCLATLKASLWCSRCEDYCIGLCASAPQSLAMPFHGNISQNLIAQIRTEVMWLALNLGNVCCPMHACVDLLACCAFAEAQIWMSDVNCFCRCKQADPQL